MKKIISSVIAIAMLSSTVAMAATVIAPTPQNVTTTHTQNFNDAPSTSDNTWYVYGSGKTQVGYGNYNNAVTQESFSSDTADKAVKVTNVANVGRGASFEMDSNTELDDNDILKISFDAAMENKYHDKSNMQFSVKINGEKNGRSVFKSYSGGWTADSFGGKMSNDNYFITDVSEGAFTHYEVIFNNGTRKVTYNSGTKSVTSDFPDGLTAINSIDYISLKVEHTKDNASASAYYLDNMSFSVTSVTDEKFEDFDGVKDMTAGSNWAKPTITLNNAKFIPEGGSIKKLQRFNGFETENVLALGGENAATNLVMPLDYTMDDDDVFTFKFDHAFSAHKDGTLSFKLEDVTAGTKNMGITFTPTKPNNETYDYDVYEGNKVNYVTNSSTLFIIDSGKIWIAGKWQSAGNTMTIDERHTITVVIDNSDEACPDASGNAQRTLAIYVDGNLQRNTKWIMTDTGADSSTVINGVSLVTGGYNGITTYFDNLWASLADNDIKVDGNDVSYTYPVVYDDATPAIFVKAYYDLTGRLISADTASATPSAGRTVTTTLSAPANTDKTKVFRWDSLDAIHHLSPAYDSSKVN